MLSFATYYLLENPTAYRRAQEEVDSVLGRSSIQVGHLKKLKYLEAVLRETLRLSPTAPRINKMVHPSRREEVATLGGRFKVEPTDTISILLAKCQRDPEVWGEDAREFKPERMLEENPNYATYQQSWKVSQVSMERFTD